MLINCFWAYSDSSQQVKDTVAEVTRNVNAGGTIHITPWENMNISGKYIIEEITNQIQYNDIFLCDLSLLNNNVLFELGYAIAQKKPIRIFLNTNSEKTKQDFNGFGLLSTIGYNSYKSARDVENEIWKLREDESTHILTDYIEAGLSYTDCTLMYLKASTGSTDSISLSRKINELCKSTTIDDPIEVPVRPLPWYIAQLIHSKGVVAHLQPEDSGSSVAYRNAAVSFVSGIAFGLQTPLLMIAPNSFSTPIDYRNILQKYITKADCISVFNKWYDDNREVLLKKESKIVHTSKELREIYELGSINIGDCQAENEQDTLNDYFVKTNSFIEALNGSLSIYIGRKGAGKTANLISLADEHEKNRDQVCVVKPIDYEIEGIIEILNGLSTANRSYLIESIWKYLIYTQLIKSIYEEIINKPVHVELDESEKEIVKFVDNNNNIVLLEFSMRVEAVVEELKKINNKEIDSNSNFP